MDRLGVEQGFESEGRFIVKGEARLAAEEVFTVLQLVLVGGLGLQDGGLSPGENVIEATEDDEREDDVLILALRHGPPEEFGDVPEEGDDFGGFLSVGHESGWVIKLEKG